MEKLFYTIDKLKLDELSVVAEASSGKASLLINGGYTADSKLKIPNPIIVSLKFTEQINNFNK